MKKILLVSIKVMDYRVSNYNYFTRRFKEYDCEFIVRSNELDKKNPHPLEFDFKEIPFKFSLYKEEIKKINPDIVIFFILLKNFFIWPLVYWLKLKRFPIVYWNKGINLEVKNPFIRNQFFYYIHNISDGIILYSKNELKYIKEKNRHKVSIANNTLNFENFPKIEESKEKIKEEFNIPFEKIVLFVGRMRKIKRVDHIIEVFHNIDDKSIGLIIVGDDINENISEKINKKNTIYLGKIYDSQNIQISKIFKMADIFCIPGEVGLGLNQAFYWGLPVITEDCPFQPPEMSYLKNNINGYKVPDNDLTELKNKILLLLNDEKKRMEFSKNARKEILENASIEKMFIGFKECIDSLI